MAPEKSNVILVGAFLATLIGACLSEDSSTVSGAWKRGPASEQSYFFLGKVTDGENICTGSLVGCGKLVLTAGHCAQTDAVSFEAHHDPSHSSWPVQQKWVISSRGGHEDLALLKLPRAPENTTTAALARKHLEKFPVQLRFAGYGKSSPTGTAGELLEGEVNLLTVFDGDSFWRGWRHTVMANNLFHKGNYVAANGPNAVLPGDSGAPLMNGPLIQGIVSQVNEGPDPASSIGFVVPLPDHLAWIETKIQAACAE